MPFFPTIEYAEQIIKELDIDAKEGHVNHPRAVKKRSI
jgi:hypothetical protein